MNRYEENDMREKIAEFPWLLKWQGILEKISALIAEKDKKMVIFTTSEHHPPEQQMSHFTKTCKVLEEVFEAVVITKLPNEEFVSWPHQGVHFSLKDGEDTILFQGNNEVMQKLAPLLSQFSVKRT